MNIVYMCENKLNMTKETLLKFIVLSWYWKMIKVGVTLLGRVDTWGITVGPLDNMCCNILFRDNIAM
jgi:hypothetical protein